MWCSHRRRIFFLPEEEEEGGRQQMTPLFPRRKEELGREGTDSPSAILRHVYVAQFFSSLHRVTNLGGFRETNVFDKCE